MHPYNLIPKLQNIHIESQGVMYIYQFQRHIKHLSEDVITAILQGEMINYSNGFFTPEKETGSTCIHVHHLKPG